MRAFFARSVAELAIVLMVSAREVRTTGLGCAEGIMVGASRAGEASFVDEAAIALAFFSLFFGGEEGSVSTADFSARSRAFFFGLDSPSSRP